MSRQKPEHYVSNKDFYTAIVKYLSQCDEAERQGKERPPIPRYIGECFMLISNRLAYRPNFHWYTYRDEMIGDSIENCCSALKNFNPERSNNPFAYFSQVAWNAFIRRIGKEHAQTYAKHANFEHMYVMVEDLYNEQPIGAGPVDRKARDEGVQRHYDVIRNFEAGLARRRKKAKKG